MKNILVPIELHSSIDSVLTSALLLGQRFGAVIEGVPLGPDLPDLVAFDVPVSWSIADQATWRDMIEEARRHFESFMAANGVPLRQAAAPEIGLSYSWSERSLGDGQVGSYARIFDLIVIGRPGPERGNPRMTTLEGALFDSGRPIILAPPVPPTSLGDTIAIAWTVSMENARATALAMPLLLQAKAVFVLTITNHRVEDPLAEQMAAHLRDNGVPARAVSRSAKSKNLGEDWLAEAAALGADLLIKGGYSRSRLRKMIFGDATSHVLTHAKLPVLMAS